MRRIIPLILAAVLLFSAAACTSQNVPAPTPTGDPSAERFVTEEPAVFPADSTETPAPSDSPEPTPEPTPTPTPKPAFRNPFNGSPMEEPLTERPFTVMINNLAPALPHCGVSKVDILYEVLAEGGVTRMLGVFSDIADVDRVGPVRSIRPYFLDVALSYDAVIGHAGGSEAAYYRIYVEGLETIDGVREGFSFPAFYRDPDRIWNGVEHALFVPGEALKMAAEEKGFDISLPEGYDSGLRWADEDPTPEDGDVAEEITVSFGYKFTSFHYDKKTGLYSAFQQGTDYIDGDTNEKVLFRNIITFTATTWVLDDYGRLSVDLFSGGEGRFFCGGKTVPITWEHEDVNSPFHYYLEDGSELELAEGKTFIAILPDYGGVDYFEAN